MKLRIRMLTTENCLENPEKIFLVVSRGNGGFKPAVLEYAKLPISGCDCDPCTVWEAVEIET